MTEPIPEQTLGRLEVAYGKLALPDWQAHASALADGVGGLSDFFLHVDASTSVFNPAPIYLDPGRVVFGLIPSAMRRWAGGPVIRSWNLQLPFLRARN